MHVCVDFTRSWCPLQPIVIVKMGTSGDASNSTENKPQPFGGKLTLAELLQEDWRLNSAKSFVRVKNVTMISLTEDGPGTILTVAEHFLPNLRNSNR